MENIDKEIIETDTSKITRQCVMKNDKEGPYLEVIVVKEETKI
jgi:hypothetical protein